MHPEILDEHIGSGLVWVANFSEARAPFHEAIFVTRAALLGLPLVVYKPYVSPLMLFTLEPAFRERTPFCKQILAVESFLASLSLIKTYGLVLALGTSYENIIDKAMGFANTCLMHFIEETKALEFVSQPPRYRFSSNVIGKKVSNDEKIKIYTQLIEHLPALHPLSCSMEDYDIQLTFLDECLELYGRKEQSNILPGAPAQTSQRVVLAVSTNGYLKTMMRYSLKRYCLPQRNFLGPTSMDHELAFIMCEVAGVKAGDVVCDPFAGTCSILVSAAVYGCIVVGSDLNLRIIRGKGGKEHFSANFQQYSLPQPIISHQDVNAMAYQSLCFDAILCDPPYSIRAGSRRGEGPVPASTNTQTEEGPKWNYGKFNISSQHQDTADIFLSVLRFAAQTLKVGGRLVFWIPYLVHEFTEDDIPSHPDFNCLYSLPQQITMVYGRRMCVFERLCARGQKEKPHYRRIPSHTNFSEKIGFHKSACKP